MPDSEVFDQDQHAWLEVYDEVGMAIRKFWICSSCSPQKSQIRAMQFQTLILTSPNQS